jgi:hypothetical protein
MPSDGMNTPQKYPRDWLPPFCPNHNCIHHNRFPDRPCFTRFGYYRRPSDNRRIQRFRCLTCRRTFSTQTFDCSYWQKHPELDDQVFRLINGGMAARQISRACGADPATINHKIGRLGRHCLLYLAILLKDMPPVQQVAFDGFETFEFSQYFPFHHHLAVDKESALILYFNDAELRRKGRMTPAQKQRRQTLEDLHGRPDPKAIGRAITELLSEVITGPGPVDVFTDDHPQYRRPIRLYGDLIRHHITPGRQHRDKRNAMFQINLADLLIRHSSANHKRETIAWSKRRQCSTARLACFAVWRNCVKGVREKERRSPTPAMASGLQERRQGFTDIFDRRLFPGHVELRGSWGRYYRGEVQTRALAQERRHRLKYAM